MYKTKYNGNINGLFTSSINLATHKFEINKIIPFPDELLNIVKNDDQGENKGKNIGMSNYFQFRQMIDREEGSKDYILEYYHNFNGGTYHGTPRLPVSDEQNYGDIIDICLKPNGKYVINRIPKFQACWSTEKMYCGFKALTIKDKLVVYYNDDIVNLKNDINHSPGTVLHMGLGTKKAALIMATIDANGNVNREIAENYTNDEHTAIEICEALIMDKKHLIAKSTRYKSGIYAEKDALVLLELK